MKKISQVNDCKTLSSLEKQRCFSKKSFQGSSPRHPTHLIVPCHMRHHKLTGKCTTFMQKTPSEHVLGALTPYWLYHPVSLAVRRQTRLHPNSPCFSVLPLRRPQPCSPRGVTQHGCCHTGVPRLPPDPLSAALRCLLPFPTATHHLELSVMAVQLSPRPQEDEQRQICLAL